MYSLLSVLYLSSTILYSDIISVGLVIYQREISERIRDVRIEAHLWLAKHFYQADQ